jgi:hypothetical protein
MSRTKHHGIEAKKRMFENRMDEWHWARAQPKWHRTLYKHKPQRQRTRIQCVKVMRGELEQVWAHDRKPWKYFY